MGYPAMLSCGAFLRVYQLRSSDQLCGTLRQMLNDSRANKRIYQHVTHLSEVILPEPEQGAHSQTRRPCVCPLQRNIMGDKRRPDFRGVLNHRK